MNAPPPDETTVNGAPTYAEWSRWLAERYPYMCNTPSERVWQVVVEFLAEHDALMPTGGETREELGHAYAELVAPCPAWHCGVGADRHRVRTVTTFPDGPLAGTHYGLWRPTDG